MLKLTYCKVTDNPERLNEYLKKTEKLDWRSCDISSLSIIFNELTRLAYDDVRYYYRVRTKHRMISAFTRFVAWALGTAGLLAPLLAAAQPGLSHLGGWGYPLLACAGSVLLFNRLFGSTKGHVRYVTAQLALEHRITLFHLDWSHWFGQHPSPLLREDKFEEVFKLFNDFVKDAYRIVQSETADWGLAVVADMEQLSTQLANKNTVSSTSGQQKSNIDTDPKR